MKIFHFHNIGHVGDNLLNLKFFFYLSNILNEKNYIIHYYFDKKWQFNTDTNFKPYLDSRVVHMKPLCDKPRNSIELWMAHNINGITYRNFERYFNAFYKQILTYLHIDNPQISTSLWIEEPFMVDAYNALDSKYKDIDIAIFNNRGFSGQYNSVQDLNKLALKLSKKFNIVTLLPISDDITSSNNLILRDIGAMSTHAKYIITPNSGPMIPCLNSYTKDYVKKWFIVGDHFEFYNIDCTCVGNDLSVIERFFDSLPC